MESSRKKPYFASRRPRATSRQSRQSSETSTSIEEPTSSSSEQEEPAASTHSSRWSDTVGGRRGNTSNFALSHRQLLAPLQEATVLDQRHLPVRRRAEAEHDTDRNSRQSSGSCSSVISPRGLTQAGAATRELSPMGSDDFGGKVRENFDEDPDYMRAHGREQFRREMTQWRQMQGEFHGREVEGQGSEDEDEEGLGSAAGSAEPRTPDGLAPGIGPRGEMLGDDWRGSGREPAMGPMGSEAAAYEEEMELLHRDTRPGR